MTKYNKHLLSFSGILIAIYFSVLLQEHTIVISYILGLWTERFGNFITKKEGK